MKAAESKVETWMLDVEVCHATTTWTCCHVMPPITSSLIWNVVESIIQKQDASTYLVTNHLPHTTMSEQDVLTPQFSPEQLAQINKDLEGKTPQEILKWAIDNVEGLYQTTAFGLTGTAAVDMISKISIEREETHLVPLVSRSAPVILAYPLMPDLPGHLVPLS